MSATTPHVGSRIRSPSQLAAQFGDVVCGQADVGSHLLVGQSAALTSRRLRSVLAEARKRANDSFEEGGVDLLS